MVPPLRQLLPHELQRLEPTAHSSRKVLPLVLVLDNIRSALNVGSIFRTADAFGVAAVALCGITAIPPHRDILKTALGATEVIPWKYFEHTTAALLHYQSLGYQLVAVELTNASIPLHQFSPTQPCALVLGNEVEGVAPEVLHFCQQAIEIPQIGSKHSLNVAVCAGIAVWHIFQHSLLK